MKSVERTLILGGVLAALAVVAARTAAADVGLYLSRTSGAAGAVIYARTSAGGYSVQPSWPVFLVAGAGDRNRCPGARCASPRLAHPPRGPRYTPIGRLSFRNTAMQGRIRFVVPAVRPGLYWLGVWCPPCYKGPGGSLVVNEPPFRVLP